MCTQLRARACNREALSVGVRASSCQIHVCASMLLRAQVHAQVCCMHVCIVAHARAQAPASLGMSASKHAQATLLVRSRILMLHWPRPKPARKLHFRARANHADFAAKRLRCTRFASYSMTSCAICIPTSDVGVFLSILGGAAPHTTHCVKRHKGDPVGCLQDSPARARRTLSCEVGTAMVSPVGIREARHRAGSGGRRSWAVCSRRARRRGAGLSRECGGDGCRCARSSDLPDSGGNH